MLPGTFFTSTVKVVLQIYSPVKLLISEADPVVLIMSPHRRRGSKDEPEKYMFGVNTCSVSGTTVNRLEQEAMSRAESA